MTFEAVAFGTGSVEIGTFEVVVFETLETGTFETRTFENTLETHRQFKDKEH